MSDLLQQKISIGPLISIIIPVFNSEKTILKTLNSAFTQTYQNIEVLVYDDASTDNTLSVIKAKYNHEPRLKLYEAIQNKGAGFARNFLLQHASGEYYAFLDSDDHWINTKLEKQIAYMIDNKIDVCSCSYQILDEDGNLIGQRKLIKRVTFTKLHLANWLPMSMTVVKATLRNATSMPNLQRRQDYAYWLRLFRDNNHLEAHAIDEFLGYYSRRKASLSSSRLKNLKYNYLVFRKYMKYNPLSSLIFLFSNIVTRILRA